MTEREALYVFLVLLAAFIVIGALLPSLAPGLIRKIDETVLKGAEEEHPPEQH